eukprot:5235902-Prymnesium_polylepis.1
MPIACALCTLVLSTRSALRPASRAPSTSLNLPQPPSTSRSLTQPHSASLNLTLSTYWMAPVVEPGCDASSGAVPGVHADTEPPARLDGGASAPRRWRIGTSQRRRRRHRRRAAHMHTSDACERAA